MITAPRLEEWLEAARARSPAEAKDAYIASLWSLLFISTSNSAQREINFKIVRDLILYYEDDSFITTVLEPCVKFMTQDATDFLSSAHGKRT
jgi:hypothetical protein